MKPTLEHRHYVEIARIIAELGDKDGFRSKVAQHFMKQLVNSNPKFDPIRFYRAAMNSSEMSGRDR